MKFSLNIKNIHVCKNTQNNNKIIYYYGKKKKTQKENFHFMVNIWRTKNLSKKFRM